MSSKRKIRKGIISASYDIEGTEAECEAKRQSQIASEIKAGKPPTVKLMRSREQPDFLKFTSVVLFYAPGIGAPIVVNSFINMNRAGLETVVVGNKDAEWMQDAYSFYAKTKKLTSVNEGNLEELSRSNTIRKGMQGLGERENENVIDVSGDTPFAVIQPFLRDPDTLTYDLLLMINVKEVAGANYPRNYHWSFEDEDGQVYTAKEPNVWIWDLDKLVKNRFGFNLIDMLFGSRKSYGEGRKMSKTLKEILLEENGGVSLRRLLSNAQILGPSGLYQIGNYAWRKWRGLPEREDRLIKVQTRTAQRLAEYALSTKLDIRVKACPQPAAIMDIDALPDVVFHQAILDHDPTVYPHHKEITNFARYLGGKWNCQYADEWISIANEMFKRYNLDAEYDKNGRMHQRLFPPSVIEAQSRLLKAYNSSVECQIGVNQDLL
ncbi:hypothetical protein JW826_03685 [Candidatus Woesearchaeota archaeon]|nr:hypothetical protein [Candidatus Woesearchaeota archaeon]